MAAGPGIYQLEGKKARIAGRCGLQGSCGEVFCKELKRDPKTAHLPVLMLTARGEEIDRVVGFEMGADGLVAKRWLEARVRRSRKHPVTTA